MDVIHDRSYMVDFIDLNLVSFVSPLLHLQELNKKFDDDMVDFVAKVKRSALLGAVST
jgi:hypothetical protein